ncbi:MAG: ATPase, T2SS/T4P/T4SS family [Polyangia bacterium]
MFSILIQEKGGETKRLEFDRPEITIGRVAGNDIVLPRGNISKRHSRIVYKDNKFIIVDLKSTNGTFVNGRKITAPLVVKGTDKIYVGDFILTLEEGTGASTSSTSDIEGMSSDAPRGAPPPPPPKGARPTALTPAIRAEPTTMDISAGALTEGEEGASTASAATPVPTSGAQELPAPVPPPASGRPPLPPLRPQTPTRPPLGPPESAQRPTLSNEALREAAVQRLGLAAEPMRLPREGEGSPLDRPVVAADRISDKATMMAGDGAAARPSTPAVSPVAAPTPAASAPASASSAPPSPSSPPAPAAAPAPAAPPSPSTSPLSGGGLSASGRPPLGRSPGSPLSSLSSSRPAASGPPRTATPAAPTLTRPTSGMQSLSSDDPQRRRRMEALTQVINKALEQLSLQSATPEQLTEAAPKLEKLVKEQADKVFPLPIGLEPDGLAKEVLADLLGGGPLDDLLADESVHEVAVASHDRIFIDRGTGQSLSERMFSSPAAVMRAVQRLVARAGGRIDSSLLEVRLEGGALLQAALPPHARVPSLVVRRARKAGGRLQDLVNQGVLSAAMSEFLEVCMRERRNLAVSGYGRLVMLGALGSATAAGARVLTVEPVSELDLSASNAAWIGLIARGTEVRSVIGQAVRMHPDHLLITDVRGPEALDVAAALCGGQGVVVGLDAASAREALGRLESLSRLAGESPSRKALREELANAVNLAVHVGRTASGAYRVMEISEVTLAEEGGIDLIPVFTFKPEGGDGQFVATGHVPAFAG